MPAARSRTFCAGRASTALATSLRHRRSWPSDSTSFVRSYRSATSSNIEATSCGCLSRDARVTRPLWQAGFREPSGAPSDGARAVRCRSGTSVRRRPRGWRRGCHLDPTNPGSPDGASTWCFADRYGRGRPGTSPRRRSPAVPPSRSAGVQRPRYTMRPFDDRRHARPRAPLAPVPPRPARRTRRTGRRSALARRRGTDRLSRRRTGRGRRRRGTPDAAHDAPDRRGARRPAPRGCAVSQAAATVPCASMRCTPRRALAPQRASSMSRRRQRVPGQRLGAELVGLARDRGGTPPPAAPVPYGLSSPGVRMPGHRRTRARGWAATSSSHGPTSAIHAPVDDERVASGGSASESSARVRQLEARSFSSGWAVPPSIAVDEMWDDDPLVDGVVRRVVVHHEVLVGRRSAAPGPAPPCGSGR